MTSGDRTIAAQIAPPRAVETQREATFASLRARAGGYAVDMVILAAIAMLFAIGALFLLLFATDFAENDPSDVVYYLCFGLLFLGVPAIWSALNIGLLLLRRQTGGQYVAALRLESDAKVGFAPRTALAWWFAGNPLLFCWPMALIAGGPLLAASALTPSRPLLALAFLVIALCAAMPLVALVSAMTDVRNRALHDRIAGVTVVPD